MTAEQRMERVEKLITHVWDVRESIQDDLRTVTGAQVVMSETLQTMARRLNALTANLDRHIAHTDERFGETTDKLNALISLMDQHLHDHPRGVKGTG